MRPCSDCTVVAATGAAAAVVVVAVAAVVAAAAVGQRDWRILANQLEKQSLEAKMDQERLVVDPFAEG